jgi:hypothetical protein
MAYRCASINIESATTVNPLGRNAHIIDTASAIRGFFNTVIYPICTLRSRNDINATTNLSAGTRYTLCLL